MAYASATGVLDGEGVLMSLSLQCTSDKALSALEVQALLLSQMARKWRRRTHFVEALQKITLRGCGRHLEPSCTALLNDVLRFLSVH